MREKVYLGDQVYCSFDGFQIQLTVENDIEATDTIYLDSHVQVALVKFIEGIVNGSVAKA